MSAVVGIDAVRAKMAAYQAALDIRLAAAVETGARQMQADLVAMAPVKDGDVKGALASDEAVSIKNPGKANVEAKIGFLTAAQKKRAFHAFFVEMGTKGYIKGQKRFAGKNKKTGRARMSKIRRNIPARPAHPFFRPAYANLIINMQRLRAEAHALALADMAKGS